MKGVFDMRICVFGAASSTIDPEYIEKVEALGREMAARGHSPEGRQDEHGSLSGIAGALP